MTAADASTPGSPADLPVGARGGAEGPATTRIPAAVARRSFAEIDEMIGRAVADHEERERSIAEILGFRDDHGDVSMYGRHRPGCEIPDEYAESDCGCNPFYDADDLLAFLVAKLAPSRYISMYGREERGVWCALITNPQSIFAEYCAPTLREALEAAVRAVAGET